MLLADAMKGNPNVTAIWQINKWPSYHQAIRFVGQIQKNDEIIRHCSKRYDVYTQSLISCTLYLKKKKK